MPELCAFREELYSLAGKRKRRKPDAALLTTQQLDELSKFLKRTYKPLELTGTVMIDCIIVVGRWLTPLEVKHVFGRAVQIFSKIVRIEEKDLYAVGADPYVEPHQDNARGSRTIAPGIRVTQSAVDATARMRNDRRISYIIGRDGRRLNFITNVSGCMYIWISNYETVELYAAANNAEEAERKFAVAIDMMNQAWDAYDPRAQRRSPFQRPTSGTQALVQNPKTLVIKSGAFALPVKLEMLKRAML